MQEMTQKYTKELRIFLKENHNNCTCCGYAFQRADTTHLGYMDNMKPAYLCDKCSDSLIETVARYFFEEREYKIPLSSAKLWRYMDFAKYISILSSNSLFFSPAANFEDIFEGAKGASSRKETWDNYYKSFLISAISNPPIELVNKQTPEEIEQNAARLLNDIHSFGEVAREETFINCWHENQNESEAMWKLYSKDTTNAICIQTTYESFYCALGCNPDIEIGQVNYIDFSKQFAPVNGSYWYKRKSFEHEKEVRAIIHSMQSKDKRGIAVPVDMNLLITNIFISPTAPKWFTEVVCDINEKYLVKAPVIQSSLIDTPFF